MKNSDITRHWFPSYALNASNPVFLDQAYSDFDAQSERLVGHDQTYLQLTAGAFNGRFLSGFLGPSVSAHIEYCNQALEQTIVASNEVFTLGVVLCDGPAFRANGQLWNYDDVMIMPPGVDLHIHSPLSGAVMAIAIDRRSLLQQSGLAPYVADWLDGLTNNISLLHAPRLAKRLREDARHALESASVTGVNHDRNASIIGDALIAGIASKLSLEWASVERIASQIGVGSFSRFLECRARIHDEWNQIDGFPNLVAGGKYKKRSLQETFATQVSVGPLTYLRLLRLHLAKRALQQPDKSGQTIGDIAANYGFWSWSRFTQQYQRQFGELPSDTRLRD